MIRPFVLLLGLLLLPRAAAAQGLDPLAPERPWRTLETEHFVVHYPAELTEWTLPVAARLDSVHRAVVGVVGNAPPRKTTTVVVDPYNVSNGFALPLLRTPTMVLWTTPPEPRTGIGEHRDWGELLAVHEYAHVAHLAWASRNPRERLLWSLLPAQLGPVLRRSPRWVVEGYATYIEGALTGTGRPHGAWRPTTLRQWALEGRFPTYAQMSAWDAFQGGAMAYMVGSAFLEWLVAQRGEESLNHLWRRMSAVQRRPFSDAFAGVFGAPPEELYGRFVVEVMREALEADRLLREGGLVEGEQFQRLGWHTGDPAISPDGTRMVLVLRARGEPSRVVVWSTEEPGPLVTEEERERLLRRDPLDVPAIDWRPRPKEALATLHPAAGRGHDMPRFLPDGRRVLVVRSEPLPDGRMRPDLFEWDTEGGAVRRITRGAALRHPDPSPGGGRAAAVQCEGGICSLVRVDLATGAVTTLQRGAADVVFHRPRYAPDGARIAVAVQAGGRWRIALTDDAGGPVRYIDPDDGHDRYDPAWLPGGDALAVVSHRGGVPNLERLGLDGTARPLTRTTGAALAPAPHPGDGSLFFLRLHTRGYDVQRLPADAPAPTGVVDLSPRLLRVAPTGPAAPVDTFPREPISPPRRYGFGPQSLRLLPGGGWTAEGGYGALTVTSIDPIGRLGSTLTGAFGEPGTWRGAGLETAWRGMRPALHGNAWWGRQAPSRQPEQRPGVEALDLDYTGAAVWADAGGVRSAGRHHARAGASFGWVQGEVGGWEERRFVFAEAAASTRTLGRAFVAPAVRLHGSAGNTQGGAWRRGLAGADLVLARDGAALSAGATYGTVAGEASPLERFAVGGAHPPLFNGLLLPQRILMPAVPLGTLAGSEILVLEGRATLGGFHPFFWAASTDDGFSEWYRVIGADQTVVVGPASLVRVPRLRVTTGVGYPLDEPFRRRLRGYVSIGYAP